MIFIISVVIYLSVLLGVGFYKSKFVKTGDDFVVAGRQASFWMLAGSLVCTWIGSGSLFGSAGLAFKSGFSELWFSSGAWLGILFISTIAYKVRKISQYTLTDILEKRYNRTAKILGTITIIISYMVITGYQFKGGGRLLSIITNGSISPELGTALTAVFIISFTLLAGMVSIMSIDIINGIVMILAIFISLPMLIVKNGGAGTLLNNIKMNFPDRLDIMGGHDPIWVIGLILPTLLLLLSESSIYQKFSSAKDPKTAKKAVIGMLTGVILIEVAMASLAVVGFALYMKDPRFWINGEIGNIINQAKAEEIILRLGFEKLPLWAGLLLINSGVAIIISTGNTFLMVTSTNTVRDLLQPIFKFSNEKIVKIQRYTIAGLGILAYLLVTQFQTILEMAFIAYTMIGASLTPALLATFFWKRVTTKGGVASILAGMLTTVLFVIINKILIYKSLTYSFLGIKFPISTDYIAIPAFFFSMLFLIFVSLMTEKEDKWRLFFD